MRGNLFHTVVIGVFAALTVAGFIFFAMFRSSSDVENAIGDVRIWGTVDNGPMQSVEQAVIEQLPRGFQGSVKYEYKDPATFHDVLVDALAAGTGPDLFLLAQDDILEEQNKIFTIPYESYSARRFKDTFIEGAEIFTNAQGIIAFPLLVDPLIMYWNRDILSREGLSTVPKYWADFLTLSPKLTKRDKTANILQSTVALGEYRNVTNAKEIISTLIMQTDNPITRYNATGDVDITLTTEASHNNETSVEELDPVSSALRFYTEFSNPIKAAYSWNRALPSSRQTFLAGDLAFYFGFASEIPSLRKANPNLNFDIARIPQIKDDPTPMTFGKMYGVAIAASTKNLGGSFRVATLMMGDKALLALHEQTSLPPVTRSMLISPKPDDIQPIFFDSALIARAWLEPGDEVDNIFQTMIESISSGRVRITEAVGEAHFALTHLLTQ